MWDRKLFKENAKLNEHRNHWPAVGVTILAVLLTGETNAVTYNFTWNVYGSDLFNYGYYGMGGDDWYNLLSALIAVWMVAMVFLIYASIIRGILRLLVSNQYVVGESRFYMENRVKDNVKFNTVKFGFTKNYGNVLLTQFLKDLYIFLWSLLLIVPGIVRGYGYFCVQYILSENPDIDHNRALELSREMTNGFKWKIFVTDLSFILWYMLNGLTLGILGIFYLNPYIHATRAEMYAFLRGNALANGITTTAELQGFGEEASIPAGERTWYEGN